jgi:hypothetical protein
MPSKEAEEPQGKEKPHRPSYLEARRYQDPQQDNGHAIVNVRQAVAWLYGEDGAGGELAAVWIMPRVVEACEVKRLLENGRSLRQAD